MPQDPPAILRFTQYLTSGAIGSPASVLYVHTIFQYPQAETPAQHRPAPASIPPAKPLYKIA